MYRLHVPKTSRQADQVPAQDHVFRMRVGIRVKQIKNGKRPNLPDLILQSRALIGRRFHTLRAIIENSPKLEGLLAEEVAKIFRVSSQVPKARLSGLHIAKQTLVPNVQGKAL